MSYDKYIVKQLSGRDIPKKSVNVKVLFSNGDYITTSINTDLQGAKAYYLGKYFNLGVEGDNMQKAIEVIEIN